MVQRCAWATDDKVYMDYHDHEWGKPSYDDIYLFEMLSLEGAQAGLSWITILKRRPNYHKAFCNFDPKLVSQFTEDDIQALLQDKGIIRNQRKIRSVVKNATHFLEVQREFGSFSKYIWQFVGGKPIENDWETHADVPDQTTESKAMSKDLKKRGFSFVGPTICYAFMQATGMVNDHTKDCYLYHGNHK
ncbi:MAG TPA: DNA-3-methyladenine glycosylase I [Bacillota bacterium]|nr:DNA-3-methyladenine glycosylase I [Bacillota bacterium]